MIDYFVSYEIVHVEEGHVDFGNAQVTLPHHICTFDDIKKVSEMIQQMINTSDTIIVLFYKEMIAE